MTAPTGDRAAATALDAIAAGSRIGRYVVRRTLGTGAFGVVYGADDPLLGRRVALKLLAQPSRTAQVVAEARALARVSHPHVIAIYDVGALGELAYIAMEQITGVTLREWQRGRTRRAILGAYLQVGEGLAAVHAAGLVHRDVKPDNALVGADGRVRLVDFGTAHDLDAAPAATAGTPLYMAPEQHARGAVDGRADQFGFCVALVLALTGQHPFGPGDPRPRACRGELDEAALRGLPEALRPAIARGLAADPAARFARIDELLDAIRACLAAPVRRGGGDPIGNRVLAGRPARARAPVAGVAAIAACVGASLAIGGGEARGPTARAVAEAVAGAPGAAPGSSVAPGGDPPVRAFVSPRRITSTGDVVRAAALSPDERSVAYLTERAVAVQPLRAAAAPRTVLAGDLGAPLAWSPDGAQLATVRRTARGTAVVRADLATGALRELPGRADLVALLGEEVVATAGLHDRALAIRTFVDPARGPAAPARACPLPGAFTLVRRLAYHPAAGALFVQLDHGDRRSTIVRIERAAALAGDCTGRAVAGPLPILSFALRTTDARVFARRASTHDLVELDGDARIVAHHAVQSEEYEPLAVRGDGSVVHVNLGHESTLAIAGGAAPRELLSRLSQIRFARAPDGKRLAYIDGIYRSGVLRVGPADETIADAPPIATGVVDAAWSPDGARLGLLFETRDGYDAGTWDAATGALSGRRTVRIAYDMDEMTWLDARRLAFGRVDRSGYDWLDLESGWTGHVLDGGAPRFGLALGPQLRRFSFLTIAPEGTYAWLWDARTEPRRIAPVRSLTPARLRALPRVAWPPGERAVQVYAPDTGERWAVRDDGVRPLPALALRRGEVLAGMFPLAGAAALIHTERRTGDLYVSVPQ